MPGAGRTAARPAGRQVERAVEVGQDHEVVLVPWPLTNRTLRSCSPDASATGQRPPPLVSARPAGRAPVGGQPDDPGVPAEPGVLAAGEPPGGPDGLARGPRPRVHSAVEEPEHLRVAERPARGPPVAQAGAAQRRGPRPQARPRHIRSTRAAIRAVELGARSPVQADLDARRRRGVVAGQRGGERPAGQLDDLEGPDDPAAVARAGSRAAAAGSRRGQPRVQRAPAPTAASSPSSRPHRRVGAGELSSSRTARMYSAGAADQDRAPRPRAAMSSMVGAGQPLVLGDAGGLGDVPDVEQVMRHAAPLVRR